MRNGSKTRRRRAGASKPPDQKLLTRPAPEQPGSFGHALIIRDFVILSWDTSYGTIGLAHSLRSVNVSAPSLAEAVYGQFRERMHKIYAALVAPQARTNLDGAPELQAIDLYPDCRSSDQYEVTWRQLANVLGEKAPWFHWALRDQDTISAWKPGEPTAIIPAEDLELPTRALTELAADEPDGSPAAAVCLWLARHVRRQAAGSAQRDINEIRAAAGDPDSDCAYMHIAAIPAPLLRPEDQEPDEPVRRAGWAQIVERRDVLAAAAADAVLRWDGGRAWPAGDTAEFDPSSCAAAAEWTDHLVPVPAGQPPTVLERHLLQHVSSVDQGELFCDERSGCPALRRADHLGKVTVFACAPQRISTAAPLSEVTLSGNTVWIRAIDGSLWLAPELRGLGLSWGYSGGGPHALAALLGHLLDDITSPPISTYDDPHQGLLSLISNTPKEGTTIYDRSQLLSARRG
jgi:hypothetical protein